MKKLIQLLLLFIPLGGASQTIELNLPSCYHMQYHLAIKQANKLDTIAKGRFDEVGKASFEIDKKHSAYVGVGELTITATPKKWNIILNGEERIGITEVEGKENEDGVIFSHSAENIARVEYMHRYENIVTQYNEALVGASNTQSLFAIPAIRVSNAKKAYSDYLKEVNESPLYAARMMEVMLCLMGSGSELGQNQEDTSKWQQEFISNELDLNILYTSGFWQTMLDFWMEKHLMNQNDEALLADTKRLLSRTEEVHVRRELTNGVIRLFSRYGKDNLLMELGSEYLTIPINGKPAPLLVTDGAPIKLGKSLILFYDSECGNCHNELHQLIESYPLLSNDHNQMRVITVSADTDKDTFEYTNQKLPWADKLCDFKGFYGENFKNYGIVGTPTFILVDDEGIVRGRYAKLSEFLK